MLYLIVLSTVHRDITSQCLVEKHKCWLLSIDGTLAHAYSPVEGMVSRCMVDAKGFNWRFHLIRRLLLDYMMLKRSPGPKVRGVPSSIMSCLKDLLSLISPLSTVTPSGRWNQKEVLCYGKKKEHLTGICKHSEAWTQATWLQSPFWFKQSLANSSSGLDAVVFIHLL